jgi:hypothetical protein
VKKKVFDKTGNWMKINTGHKTFDRQTNIISNGNVIANTMTGLHIRSWDTTRLSHIDEERPLGHLFNFDIKPFDEYGALQRVYFRGTWWRVRDIIRELLENESGWLYAFHHYNGAMIKRNRVNHGLILTHYNHVLWKTWVIGPTYKSWNVINECAKYVSFIDEAERAHHK